MKNVFFFLVSMVTLFCSCDKQDDTIDNITGSYPQKVRWYGVNMPDVPSTRGVADEGKLWNARVGIYVKFINNPSDAGMIEKIKSIASEWGTYAGIKFHFVENDRNADVRIAFDWNGNDWLTWSYTGTDAKFVRNQNEPTAVFGGLQYQDDDMFKGDVLRVFGQILGLEYEQRHQDWTYWRAESQLERYWESMFEGLNMNWDEIREYVFTPLTGENAIYPTQTDEVDELSVMAWPYYTRTQTTNLLANFELSAGDKAFIAQLYPNDKQSLPTIQEAWVDAGYFVWTNSSKTALRITELGRQQEYLPDVRDGEQLTEGFGLFRGAAKLEKAPFFNSSNITDFSYMFSGCTSLTNTQQLDTSKGLNFSRMFQGCSSLKEIPLIDTSTGTNFEYMFYSCVSLKTIPKLNTSSGTNFQEMFHYCDALVTIPLLDTSKGINFRSMFWSCGSLITIPLLNTSNGINFYEMLYNCKNLITIPLLNTSKGTNFSRMFMACNSLITIPLLDTSNGTNFGCMFTSCYSLTQLPQLDTSKGNIFFQFLMNCRSLTQVPQLNTSNGTNFSWMLYGCSSLKEIPLLNTSNGSFFSRMFMSCTSLVKIPPINTSNGSYFERMFYNCKSLQEKPELDLSNATDITNMYYGTPFAQ